MDYRDFEWACKEANVSPSVAQEDDVVRAILKKKVNETRKMIELTTYLRANLSPKADKVLEVDVPITPQDTNLRDIRIDGSYLYFTVNQNGIDYRIKIKVIELSEAIVKYGLDKNIVDRFDINREHQQDEVTISMDECLADPQIISDAMEYYDGDIDVVGVVDVKLMEELQGIREEIKELHHSFMRRGDHETAAALLTLENKIFTLQKTRI